MDSNTCGISAEELFIANLLRQNNDSVKLNNFLTVSKELKERSSYSYGYPLWLTIDPTNICSLKCPFCPNGFGNIRRPKGMMAMDDFRRIIDILGPYLLHIDMQNWGEPLFHKDIYKMISYAKKFDIHITMSTNFQNFDERGAEEIIGSGLDRLIVSIDGASQETYEKYRRGGDFGKAIGNIRTLVNKKKELKSLLPMVIWQFLVFRHNEHEIGTAERMAGDLGVDRFGISRAFIAADSPAYRDWVPLDKRFSKYDMSRASVTASGSDRLLKQPPVTNCNWLWQGIAVNWDTSVSPCCGVYLEEEDFGNIFACGTFRELWNNTDYRSARKFMLERESNAENMSNTCVRCSKIGQINLDLNPDFWAKA
jgi:MoaA/NifB/PqqE/SkfB family radical SAM enzyme